MNEPLARSPRAGIPAQTYPEHVQGVVAGAEARAEKAASFFSGDRSSFVNLVRSAAIYHDLGKLDPANQAILSRVSRKKLEVDHEDAGTCALLRLRRNDSAVLVACHHKGLFSRSAEMEKNHLAFRIPDVAELVDQRLDGYLSAHEATGCTTVGPGENHELSRCGFGRRIALSCLVDADHSDSAAHTGKEKLLEADTVEPRWADRRIALDRYVSHLAATAEREGRTDRLSLRQELYCSCRDAETDPPIRTCEAPVGSGKTTAVMAHLLRVAEERGLRHIFVVLPYTNIIRQSVRTYREALVLPGEEPEQVVAEHHHQADFSDRDLRHLATLWRAPIIVTTAVQFFETLSACSTPRLRKLHELVGSAVFLDEAHAAIPTPMWPQVWRWLRTWVDEWSGHMVLGSGSLARFWMNEELVGSAEEPMEVPDLASDRLRFDLARAESRRIAIRRHEGSLSCEELIEVVQRTPGPRLVILNTVQAAAFAANRMREGGATVRHLSTALAPVHREPIIEELEAWLRETASGERNPNWTLVATSCVEAGMNFSFHVGFRESASAASLIQVSGRVNREALRQGAETWDFRLNDPLLTGHPGLGRSRSVLDQLFDEGLIGSLRPSDLTSEAFDRELTEEVLLKGQRIEENEGLMEYREVARDCRVIPDETETVLIDDDLVEKIRRGERIEPRTVMMHCVQMWPQRIKERGLEPVLPPREDRPVELWAWGGLYDPDFLGYMKEIVPLVQARGDGGYLGV